MTTNPFARPWSGSGFFSAPIASILQFTIEETSP